MTITTADAPDATPAGGLVAPDAPQQTEPTPAFHVTADHVAVTHGLERPLLCVCGGEKREHAGAASRGGLARTACARMRLDKPSRLLLAAIRGVERTLGQDLRNADGNRNRARDKENRKGGVRFSVGPSDASSCRKAVEYRENPPADYEPIPTDKRAALMGTLVHEGVRRIRKRRYPWRLFELPVDVPGLDRPGKCDEYDPMVGVVNDLKTAGDWKWEAIAEDGPPQGEWEQAQMYALGLARAGHYVTEVRITYVQRANGKDEVYVRPYDEAFALAAVDKLVAVLDALDAGLPLPRDREGPSTDTVCRVYCPARDHCWNVPAAEAAQRSPESWTLVHDDEDVEYQLSTYAEARTVEGDAKKTKERAKALLDGVPEGQYGEWYWGHTGGKMGEPKPDIVERVKQLEGVYDAPDDVRPPLVDLPMPTVRKTSPLAVKVKHQRAAAREKARRFPSAADPTVSLVHPGRLPVVEA